MMADTPGQPARGGETLPEVAGCHIGRRLGQGSMGLDYPATTRASRPRWWTSAALTLALVAGSTATVVTTAEQTVLKHVPVALKNSCTTTGPETKETLPLIRVPEEKSVSASLPLQEFRTPNNAGWFYTLNQSEAESAATRYGFTRQGAAVGRLRPHTQPCTEPLYRLRTTTGSSYLVTGSTSERDSLAASGQFINEGVLGYIDTEQQPGTVHLMRFSNHGQWRLAPESQAADQQAAGYTLDGPVGWVLP